MMNIDQIARVCHEANRAYCLTLGDASQVPWDVAPQWQRDSMLSGVRLHLEDPAAGPEQSHEAWMQHKTAGGWRYGPIKDEAKKEHPCLVPYNQLPIEQRLKDSIIIALVKVLSQS